MKSWFYYITKILVRLLLFLFTDYQVRGRENIPRAGAIIVVANHLNLADPLIVGITLGRKAVFMAKRELFRSKLSGYFVHSVGAFPVHRGQLDREALRQAHQVLTKSLALVVFPEGSRSQNAQLQPAFPGSALVALRNSAPILPIGITGTEKIKGLAWFVHRPKVTVNIGHPFSLPLVASKLTKAELAEVTDLIMARIAELLPKEYRGHYAEKLNDQKN
jgi:1-acyl-sn-glycerol-3-phosphate acyltransferase